MTKKTRVINSNIKNRAAKKPTTKTRAAIVFYCYENQNQMQMGSNTAPLEAMIELQNRDVIEIDNRKIYGTKGSAMMTIPKCIVEAKGLAAGDEITVQYDPEREEVVIPVGGGEGKR